MLANRRRGSAVYHGKDLRKGRYLAPHQAYLLTAVTYCRRPLFEDWQVGRLLVSELRLCQKDGLVDSLAWVVMPDHLHWLIVLDETPLHRLMQRVKSRSAIAINRHLQRHEQVWQKGYHDRGLCKEEDLKSLARYVVANPLRAGLVDNIGDYPLWDASWL